MRFKFKPNVNAPRGSSTASVGSSSGAGVSDEGGDGGGGGEVRRKRRRLRSRGDESAGTEGESASELESGETSHPRRRRRKTSEGSSTERGAQRGGEGGQHQSAVKESTTTKTTSSQSTKESVSTRTESTQKASSTAEALHAATDNHTQACTSSAAQVEAGSSEGPVTRGQTSTSEKATEEVQTVHSSAGQVESSADSELHMSTLAMLLTRGNAVAAASGRTVPKIKKKVAPKVVSSRPKRAPRPSAGRTDENTPEPDQSTSQQQENAEINAIKRTENTSLVEREDTSQSTSQEDDSLSPHRTHTNSERISNTDRTRPNNTSSSSNEAHSEPSNKALSTNQTTDEATSSTLNEILRSAQSQEQTDSGLNLGALRGFTTNGDDIRVPGDGDTIVVTSEEGGQNEVEIRTNEKSTATTESDESFIVQGYTDAMERTTCTSESPQSVTDKTGQTSVSSSPSSSQEQQQSSSKLTSRRRGGSAGPRSRRSESRASSVGSEAGGDGGEGEGEKDTTRTPTKGKRRQKRKKTSADSTPSPDEPGSQGASPSPSPKKARTSAVKVREAPDRSTMTMQELIYYNPTANPMSSSVEEKKRKKEEGQSVSGQGSRASSVQPPAGSRATSPAIQDGGGGAVGGANDDDSGDGRIVPTLRIGVDGKIVIDESSMVMETTQQEPLEDGGEIVMDSIGHTTSASYRRRCKVTRWTKEETNRFFKALRQVGTDFTMMTLLIPKRSRRELKNKFKKEERNNPHLVSQALTKT